MKFFIVGLPHTKTLDRTVDPTFTACAFTTKIWYLCRMMYERGHTVIHLGNEGSNPKCTQHISVGNPVLWEQNYGKRKPTEMFNTSQNAYTQIFYQNVRKAILENMGEKNSSIICLPFGVYQKEAIEEVPQLVVESGIGYADSFADCRVFESYTWMAYTMGRQLKLWEGGKWYWSVIPNGTDPDIYGPVEKNKDDYFLLMCRLNWDKGVEVACQTARAIGVTIKIIGQGDPTRYLGPGVEYYPPMNPNEFVPIMRKAKGLFSPTIYPEPFGCTHIEAMMCGCPVITTDWSVYGETVQHGKTGYRCRTRDHFIWAAKNIDKIDPLACREYAISNYGLDKVGAMYDEYFQSIMNLSKPEGWETLNPNRTQLDWLNRDYSMFYR